jgi:hypothetical protein
MEGSIIESTDDFNGVHFIYILKLLTNIMITEIRAHIFCFDGLFSQDSMHRDVMIS